MAALIAIIIGLTTATTTTLVLVFFSRAPVSAVNCLVVLPPLFIILAVLLYMYFANKLIG